MSGYLVSIIVPVYNVEKYLEKCLKSIELQDYTNIEVILVDDGSTDSSGQICDQYAKEHDSVVVIHQPNQGQAAARNHAANMCHGEFIAFIDSDDSVVPEYISYLVSLQLKYGTDIVIARGIYCYEGAEEPTYSSTNEDYLLKPEEVLIRLNYNKGMAATPWAKLFRKNIILKHPFPEGQIYEDLATIYKIVGDSQGVAYGDRKIYFWLQREGSTMRSRFNEKQLAAFSATREQLEYMKKNFPSVVPSVKARHMTKIIELMPYAIRSVNSRMAYHTLLKEMIYYKEVMKDKNIRNTQRIRLKAIRLGYYPAKLITLAHESLKKREFSQS